MLTKIISAALALAVAMAPVAQACTGIQLTAKDGGVVAARTLEFGIDPKSEAMVIPAGTAITGTLPDSGKGISYVTKYGVVGANGLGQPVILDGINEASMSASSIFPTTRAMPMSRRIMPLEQWGHTSTGYGY